LPLPVQHYKDPDAGKNELGMQIARAATSPNDALHDSVKLIYNNSFFPHTALPRRRTPLRLESAERAVKQALLLLDGISSYDRTYASPT
jgi:hypothetical protein